MSDAAASRIAFLDVSAGHRELRAELDAAYSQGMGRGQFVLGPEVEAFESEWAEYCGATHCVGVGSGQDALTLSLRGLGIGPGDEVLVPSNTYIATWLAVSAVGATPVPVEPNPDTHVVEVDALRAAITPRTAALLPVHQYGLPVDAPALEALASQAGLALLFDAAQAHGARIAGKPIGAFGTASAFSFYPSKNLGALGDAGAVTTNDATLALRLRRLRNYGSDSKHQHAEQGANSRLDELQAAFLRVKLRALPEWNARRAARAARYHEVLAGSAMTTQTVPQARVSAWHLYVIRSPRRDEIQAFLREHSIETLVHYPTPPHLQPAYAQLGMRAGQLPVAERLAAEVLSLPCGPHLTDADQRRVSSALQRLLR